MPIRTARIHDDARRDYLVRKGAEALALGERAEALSRYRAALEYDAENDRLRAVIAQVCVQVGEPRQAAAELTAILDRRPADADAWNLLGVLLMENGEREDAVRCWKKARALAPGFELPARNLAQAPSYPQRKRAAPLQGREERERLFGKRPPRLSVCLIVKDEEDLLPDCLDSVAGLADEIVVVDTGSADRTAEIAREKGARVHPHRWTDDFAAARNEALSRARGDWILMIDADERLDPRDADAVRSLMEAGTVEYATVSIESVIGAETLPTRALRIFRNYPELCYVGRIHEQLGASLRPLAAKYGLRGGAAPVRLVHLGYDPARFAARGKAERNSRLLAHELAENPGNAYALLKQGESLFSQGRFEEAGGPIDESWRLTRKAVDEGADRALLEEPATLLAACAVAGGRFEPALEVLDDFHGRSLQTANTRYLEGISRWALGREGAGPLLEEAIAMAGRAGEIFTLPEIRGATPLYVLGAIALAGGDPARAAARFSEALALDPAHRDARLGLAEAFFHEGRPEASVSILAGMLEHNAADLQAWCAGGLYLGASRGRGEALAAWLEAAMTVFPDDPILRRLRAEHAVPAPAGAA